MTVTIAGTKVDIITTITDREKSRVYLAIDEKEKLHILKHIIGENKEELYRKLASLNSDHLVRVENFEYRNGDTFVLEEYIEGCSLEEVLKAPIRNEDGIDYMNGICQALCELHQLTPSIIHRDIKPENILVDKLGRIKITDFDAARENKGEDKDNDTVALGTRGYASPEQYGFSQTDERSDIYSAGVVLEQILSCMKLNPFRYKRIKRVADRATMFDPKRRYLSAEQLRDAIYRATSTSILFWPAIGIIALTIIFGTFFGYYRVQRIISCPEYVISKTINTKISTYDEDYVGNMVTYAFAEYSETKNGKVIEKIVLYTDEGIFIEDGNLEIDSKVFCNLKEGFYHITIEITNGNKQNILVKVIQ